MEMYHSKKRFPILEIAKINIRHNSLLSIVVAIILCFLTTLLIGTTNLERNSSAMPLEMFVSLIGIILLTPVFQPEQNEEINDLVSSKYYSTTKVELIRVMYLVGVIVLLISVFALYMKIQNCDITIILIFGAVADAIFLGSMGMLASALTGNTVIGYMPPLLYYALNIGMGAKLGHFYLFSMSIGNYIGKIWMFAAGVLIIIVSLLCQRFCRRNPFTFSY